MHIAFFSKHLPSDQPNGVSVQVDRLAAALVERGHKVTCFSFSPGPQNARYTTIQLSWKNASRLWKKFLPALEFRSINKQPFDICHYHGDDYLCGGSGKRVRTFYGSALFEALHATSRPGRLLYQLLFYKLEWLSCLRGGTLVAISRPTKRALPLIRHVVPCGVPVDRYTPLAAMKTAHPSVLFIGDFKGRKQGALLLRAFAEKVLPVFPGATLTVVGPKPADAKNVRCLGRVSEGDLINEYRKAWVYCLPSSYEGFGVPVIEAMACGTAVVAVENPGTRELIETGRDGILCGPEKLGDSIRIILENSGLRNSIIIEGFKKAEKYDITTIAEYYEAIYKNAVFPERK